MIYFQFDFFSPPPVNAIIIAKHEAVVVPNKPYLKQEKKENQSNIKKNILKNQFNALYLCTLLTDSDMINNIYK